MMNKLLLCPERVRQLPPQFSWIDQRLAHGNWFQRAAPQAWLLYLFLVTVADAQGLSYYAERTLCQRLGFDTEQLLQARAALLRLGLIAYRAPLYQVLALQAQPPSPPRPPSTRTPPEHARHHLRQLQHLLQRYRSRS